MASDSSPSDSGPSRPIFFDADNGDFSDVTSPSPGRQKVRRFMEAREQRREREREGNPLTPTPPARLKGSSRQ